MNALSLLHHRRYQSAAALDRWPQGRAYLTTWLVAMSLWAALIGLVVFVWDHV